MKYMLPSEYVQHNHVTVTTIITNYNKITIINTKIFIISSLCFKKCLSSSDVSHIIAYENYCHVFHQYVQGFHVCKTNIIFKVIFLIIYPL
jgi:hypothetical protein